RTPRMAIPLGGMVYLALLSIQIRSSLRYFLPLLPLLPLALTAAKLPVFTPARLALWRWAVAALCAAAAVSLYWAPLWVPLEMHPRFFYTEYRLPVLGTWHLAWPMGYTALTLMGLAAAVLCGGTRPRNWMLGMSVAFVATHLAFANYAVSKVGASRPPGFTANQLLLQVTVLGALAAFVFPSRHRERTLQLVLLTLALLACIWNTHWRSACEGLMERRRHMRLAAERLEKHLPSNAIIIGRFASTLLRGSHLRVGFTCPNYAADEFVRRINRLVNEDPDRPVFWLVEPGRSDQASYYRRSKLPKPELKLVLTLNCPWDGSPQPAPLCVYRLLPATRTSSAPQR
ncbi:MAG: hypothetical protein N3B01_08845, partial [Verrucomicrobiae bacterium]|nr:hypothetical protein [Verrucomicrobiae bacterium]